MDRRALLGLIVVCACGGESGGGGGGDDTGPDAPSTGTGWEVSYGPRAALFAQQNGASIYRWTDTDDDGDFNEAGERTLFVSNTGTALGPMLAVDAVSLLVVQHPNGAGLVQIALMGDANSDGDAVDAGERRAVFAGTLPGGEMLPRVGAMTRAKDGSLYVVEQSNVAGQRIYRLSDGNSDGDMDDVGEAAQFAVGPMGFNTVALAVDGHGELWFAANGGGSPSGADIYRVRNGAPTRIVERAALKAARDISANPGNLVALADGSVGFSADQGLPRQPVFVALRDEDNNREITLSEAKVIWNMTNGDFYCLYEDVQVLGDGSIVALDQNDVFRFVDGNASRDFLDVGETHVAFDEIFARTNGQVAQGEMLNFSRIAAAVLP